MTADEIAARARTLARVTDFSIGDTEALVYVSESCQDFSREIGGFWGRSMAQVSLRLTPPSSGSIAIVTNTGTYTFTFAPTADPEGYHDELLADFATFLTDSWTTTTFAYDRDAQSYSLILGDAAETEITSVTDGGSGLLESLFGAYSIDNTGDPTIAGTTPEMAYTYVDVSDYLSLSWMTWKTHKLRRRAHSYYDTAKLTGAPAYFAEYEDEVVIWPIPRDTPWVSIGGYLIKSAVAGIPEHYHMALVHRVAAYLSETNEDFERSSREVSQFMKAVAEYRVRRDNENPKIGFAPYGFRDSGLVNGEVS